MHNKVIKSLLNARLIDPESSIDQKGGLLIEDGLIRDFGPHIDQKYCTQREITAQDCQQQIVMPGLVDMRVQIQPIGQNLEDSLVKTSNMAVVSGVTSLVCVPTASLIFDQVNKVSYLQQKAKELAKSKLYTYGAITQNLSGQQITEMGLLKQAGVLGFTEGIKSLDHPKVFNRALNYAQNFNSLILQFAEDQRLADGSVATQTALSIDMGLPSVPAMAEAMQITRDLHFVAASQANYHCFPVSTRLSATVLKQAKEKSLPVSCSTSPSYFILNEQVVCGYNSFARLSPPLRSQDDQLAVIQAIQHNIIDCICSDHTPIDSEGKTNTFNQSTAGIMMLPFLFPLTLELYRHHEVRLINLLKLITCNPAKVLGLPQGRLKIGSPADLIVVDIDSPTILPSLDQVFANHLGLFQDIKMHGRILQTYVDGRLVHNLF
ncbi:MAG: amidohydrolase family protein [Alphaproteobacteria bacterium]|nr:amidohydrolase family protein [Alphaproteobacteria bacterium]